jgi:hypothetical protein
MKGNTNKESNGYVVFIWNVSKKLGGGEGWGRYSARPHSFLQQTSGQIFKDDMSGFPSNSDKPLIYSLIYESP